MKTNAKVPKKKKRKRRGDAVENADRILEAIIFLKDSGTRPTAIKIAERVGLSRKTVSKHLKAIRRKRTGQ